jgi:hypothetical protein
MSDDRPGNGKAPVARPTLKSQSPTAATITAASLESQILVWFREATRLAYEYRSSAHVRHLRAFCRHVIGIMATVERNLPR